MKTGQRIRVLANDQLTTFTVSRVTARGAVLVDNDGNELLLRAHKIEVLP